jgi:glucose-1-phosphate adenylyltransferase
MGAERSITASCQKAVVLLLAGGLGTRLQPLTLKRVKPLVPYGGTLRLIDLTLDNCVKSGLRRIALLTQGHAEQVHDYVGSAWKNKICTLSDTARTGEATNKGTADAVSRALRAVDKAEADYVFIFASDHIYRMDYRRMLAFHMAHGAGATVGAVEMPLHCASSFGVLEIGADCKVRSFEEKPPNPRPLLSRPAAALVSMGIYLFSRDVLAEAILENRVLSVSHDLGCDVMPALAQSGLLHAYDFRDERSGEPRYWRDVGTLDAYYQANMDLTGSLPPFSIHPQAPQGVHSVGKSHADAVVSRCILSSRVQIEEGAVVSDSILMTGARIGRGARVRRAIIEEGIEIPEGIEVGYSRAEDEKRFTVSPGGIAVVARTVPKEWHPARTRPTWATSPVNVRVMA